MEQERGFKLVDIGDCFINGANDSLFFGIYQCLIGTVISFARLPNLHDKMLRAKPIIIKVEKEEERWTKTNYTKQMSLLSDMI